MLTEGGAVAGEMFQHYAPMTAYAMDARCHNPPDCDTGDMHKQAIWIGGGNADEKIPDLDLFA